MVVTLLESCKAFLDRVLKRPHIIWTLLFAIPGVLFFGGLVLTFGISDLIMRSFWLKRGRWGPVGSWAKYNFSRWILWSHRVEVEYLGPGLSTIQAAIQAGKSFIYVANHQSYLDIPVLMRFLPTNSSFIAKKEILYIPVLGWAGYGIGTIFIDRKRGAQNTNLQNVKHFLKAGISIIVFPEGTRSVDAQVAKFKKGAFVFAIQTQTDIIPISIDNSAELLPKSCLKISPGKIRVYIDRPISPKGLNIEDRTQFADQARNLIAKNLEVLRESRKNRPG